MCIIRRASAPRAWQPTFIVAAPVLLPLLCSEYFQEGKSPIQLFGIAPYGERQRGGSAAQQGMP